MHTVLAAEGLSHMDYFANAQIGLGNTVGVYSAIPRSRAKGFPKNYDHHWVPSPAHSLRFLFNNKLSIPRFIYDLDCAAWDKAVALTLEDAGVVLGSASSSLYMCRAAKKMGAKFILDRACPDIRVQERVMEEEAKRTGGTFVKAPKWFLDRQIAEYEEADFIVAPSDYSRRHYPEHLKAKTVIARLTGHVRTVEARRPRPKDAPFTVGVVGGNPMRKGYLYLMQAWKDLGWTDAQLKIRSSRAQMEEFSVLKGLLDSQPNIELVGYVPDIADFYQSCDAFILPSIDDGFGMAFYEALGQGIPSIATSNCGSSENFTPEQDFLLVEPFSSGQIKDALTRLRESPELRQKLSTQGLATVRAIQGRLDKSDYNKGIEELMRRAFPNN